MQKISLLVAMSENGVIGDKNQLLWHLPNDLKHFKALTMGKPIIMGRKTYQSIGKPLPGRQNIILTRDRDCIIPGCDVVHSVDEALRLTHHVPEVMIIGGGEIYRLFFPQVTCMYITYVFGHFVGETTFLKFDLNEWKEIAHEDFFQDEKHAYNYRFVTLEKQAF